MARALNAPPKPAPKAGFVLANGRPAEVVEFEEGVVGFFIDAAELLGVPKSIAAVYGIVFASPVPLSFSEIAARLNFSGGSVSTGLKVLREMGAIRPSEGLLVKRSDGPPVRQSTTARASFEPDTEMRRLIQRFLEQRVETQLSRGKVRLTNLETAMAAYGETEAKVLSQRLSKLRRWHDRTRAMMPVIRTFLKLTKL